MSSFFVTFNKNTFWSIESFHTTRQSLELFIIDFQGWPQCGRLCFSGFVLWSGLGQPWLPGTLAASPSTAGCGKCVLSDLLLRRPYKWGQVRPPAPTQTFQPRAVELPEETVQACAWPRSGLASLLEQLLVGLGVYNTSKKLGFLTSWPSKCKLIQYW